MLNEAYRLESVIRDPRETDRQGASRSSRRRGPNAPQDDRARRQTCQRSCYSRPARRYADRRRSRCMGTRSAYAWCSTVRRADHRGLRFYLLDAFGGDEGAVSREDGFVGSQVRARVNVPRVVPLQQRPAARFGRQRGDDLADRCAVKRFVSRAQRCSGAFERRQVPAEGRILRGDEQRSHLGEKGYAGRGFLCAEAGDGTGRQRGPGQLRVENTRDAAGIVMTSEDAFVGRAIGGFVRPDERDIASGLREMSRCRGTHEAAADDSDVDDAIAHGRVPANSGTAARELP